MILNFLLLLFAHEQKKSTITGFHNYAKLKSVFYSLAERVGGGWVVDARETLMERLRRRIHLSGGAPAKII